MGFNLSSKDSEFIKIEVEIPQASILTIATVLFPVYSAIPGQALVLISAAIINDGVTTTYNNCIQIGLRDGPGGNYSWGCDSNFPIFEIGTVATLCPFDINNGTSGGQYTFANNLFLQGNSNPIIGAGDAKFIAYGFLVNI
jgi:hypothetical protein